MLSWSRTSARACVKASKGFGVNNMVKRGIVVSPAINENAAYQFSPVLPFGFDFASDELRGMLESRNVDVDNLERKYNVQIQDDAEFNNPGLPSEGSSLWGYVYANRLVKCKVQLDSLTKGEEYLLNYLRAQVEELEQRLKRYYPNLDWKGEHGRQLREANEELSGNDLYKGYETAKASAITSVICDNENGDDKYISLFGNNSFIDQYDSNDKFNDFLPKELENKMIEYYKFYYDHSSNNTDPREYFDSIKKLEKLIETPMNALSKQIKQNYGLFVLDCFGNNSLNLVSNMVSAFSNASSSIVDKNATGTVNDCLSLLDIKSGKVSASSGDILGKLFFGNVDAGKQLSGKDVNEVTSILSSAGEERINLIYRALQIENSLKTNSIARVFLTIVLSMNRNFMGQFLTNNGENIDGFGSANTSVMDTIVSTQQKFNTSQEKLSVALNKFVTNAANAISKDRNLNSGELSSLISSLLTTKVSECGNVDCVVSSSLREYASSCGSNGDYFGQLTGLTYANYVDMCGDSIFWYQLFQGITNPPRNGISGRRMSGIADGIANNSSDAGDALFGSIGEYLQKNGALTENESGSISSNISSLVSKDFDTLKQATNEYNSARQEQENALKSVSLQMDSKFHFEHINETYDPLNIHLAQYRYLSNN